MVLALHGCELECTTPTTVSASNADAVCKSAGLPETQRQLAVSEAPQHPLAPPRTAMHMVEQRQGGKAWHSLLHYLAGCGWGPPFCTAMRESCEACAARPVEAHWLTGDYRMFALRKLRSKRSSPRRFSFRASYMPAQASRIRGSSHAPLRQSFTIKHKKAERRENSLFPSFSTTLVHPTYPLYHTLYLHPMPPSSKKPKVVSISPSVPST